MSEQASVNPWVVQEPKPAFTPLPVGFYNGVFKGAEATKVTPTREGDAGNRLRFVWEVQTGEHKGQSASALVSYRIDEKTEGGRLISGLLGRPLTAGENVQASVDACKGAVYLLNVAPGPKGGKPQVRSCGKPPAM